VSIIQAIISGLLQGITEFFPISSSSHERILSFLLNTNQIQNDVLFDLSCHLGTVFATLYFFRKDIINIFKSITQMSLFALALVPLVIIYFSLKNVIFYLDNPKFMGFALIITSILLMYTSFAKIKIKSSISLKDIPNESQESEFLQGDTANFLVADKWYCSRMKQTTRKQQKICGNVDEVKNRLLNNVRYKIKDVLLIGSMQAMALIPGLSRSGFTISTAFLRGWSMQQAITFSFILSIPTILGGSFLETIHLKTLPQTPISIYIAAFLSSFIAGIICVHFVFKAITQKNMRYFAIYCFMLAILSFILFR
jgi:undecaprenyl-diphosphatase